jgi:hypothetical protein
MKTPYITIAIIKPSSLSLLIYVTQREYVANVHACFESRLCAHSDLGVQGASPLPEREVSSLLSIPRLFALDRIGRERYNEPYKMAIVFNRTI